MAKLPYLRSFRIVAKEEIVTFVEDLLHAEGYEFEKEPFSPLCFRLLSEPQPLGSSLAAFFGYIYIQDRSSMLPALALNPASGSAVLDMCASPGSKSGFLAQLTGDEGSVLANEPNPQRLTTLRANMLKLNLLNVATCSCPGEKLPLEDNSWPYILLDPPCSGWGTEDKHPLVKKLWQGEKIATLINIQKLLIEKASSLLAPGGYLLYSTCTTNPDENRGQIAYATEKLDLARVPLAPFPGFVFAKDRKNDGDLLVCGQNSAAQGFYLCLLQKREATPPGEQTLESLPNKDRVSRGLAFNPEWFHNSLLDYDLLPKGQTRLFGSKARFLPQGICEKDCENLKWQGAPLGTYAANERHFSMLPRLRSLLDADSSARIQIDDPGEIRKLLAGQCLRTDLKLPQAGLWWRKLPLGTVSIKAGRIIASFR